MPRTKHVSHLASEQHVMVGGEKEDTEAFDEDEFVITVNSHPTLNYHDLVHWTVYHLFIQQHLLCVIPSGRHLDSE